MNQPPIVFWVSQPVSPNETAMLSVGNVNDSAYINITRVPDTPNSGSLTDLNYTTVLPLQISNKSIKFVIPSSFSQGLFAYNIIDGDQTSNTYYINRAEVWFFQGDQGRTISPGGTVTVIGTALAYSTTIVPPSLKFQSTNGDLTIVSADSTWNSNPKTMCHYQTFTIPSNLPVGQYSLFYNNGFGGDNGWTLIYSYRSPGPGKYPVPTNHATVAHPVKPPSQVFIAPIPVSPNTTSDNDFANLFSQLIANNGGTIMIPPGTFNFTKALKIPLSNIVIIGDDPKTTILNWINEPTGGSLITGSLFSIMNLSITTTNPHIGSAIKFLDTVNEGYILVNNVVINLDPGLTTDTANSGISISYSNNASISNCTIKATNGVQIESSHYVNIQYSQINYWARSVGTHQSSNIIAAHNHYTVGTGYPFDGADYGMTVTGNKTAFDMYFGDIINDRDTQTGTVMGMMSFDEVQGCYFGSGTVSDGVKLTFPISLTDAMAVVMIMSGKGMGQWRWVVSGWNSTTITIDRPWDIPPDINSIITAIGMTGRVIFAGNSYLQNSGWNVIYYMSADVIEANNTITEDAPKIWAGQHESGVAPGWHYQVIGNQVVPSPGAMAAFKTEGQRMKDPNTGYHGLVLCYNVYRGNIFDGPGFIGIYTNTITISDVIIENNKIGTINFGCSSPRATISNSMMRNNIPRTGDRINISFSPESLSETIQTF